MNSKNVLLILGIFLILTIGCVNITPPGTTTTADQNNPINDQNNPITDSNTPDGNEPETSGSIIDQIIGNRDQNNPTDQNNPAVEKTFDEKLADCKALIGEEQGNCLKSLAVAEEKPEVCTEIEENGIRDNCVNAIALKKSEIQLCTTITQATLKDSCIKSIIFTTQAWGQCSTLSSEENKLSCFKKASLETQDSQYCTGMNTDSEANLCYKNYGKTVTECNQITAEADKASCTQRVILEHPTIENCTTVSDANQQEDCLSRAAVSLQDFSICRGLTIETKERTCYANTVNGLTESSQESTCDSIRLADYKSDCYNKVALNLKAPDTCTKISDTNQRETCYKDIALTTLDYNICKKVTSYVIMQRQCFIDIGVQGKITESCDLVDDVVKYLQCFTDSALALDDITTCNKIETYQLVGAYSSYPLRSLCMKNFALEKNNRSLCTQIVSTPVKTACQAGNANFK
ncbi:MAG: hypothetical protein Q7S92_02870 [Candidatus Diapherotrites archaeon]|nr:hypothetical protein [Candidatus Diapherotrites archaeon]